MSTARGYRFGVFQFELIPFVVRNAPSAFQKMTDGLSGSFCFARVYLDDVLIFSASIREHFEHFKKAVATAASYGLKTKACKCDFSEKGGLFSNMSLTSTLHEWIPR